MSAQPPRLLDQVRAALRRKHYSIRTEDAYVSCITRDRGERRRPYVLLQYLGS
jgi:hypothetical protein